MQEQQTSQPARAIPGTFVLFIRPYVKMPSPSPILCTSTCKHHLDLKL
jgi:hypothetical protein